MAFVQGPRADTQVRPYNIHLRFMPAMSRRPDPDVPIPMRDQIGAGPNRGVGMCAPWTSDPKITTIP